jgi:hypothetical protein
MKGVTQTKYGRDGDYFQACVASVLEVELVDVPAREAADTPEQYVDRLRVWLEPRGLSLIALNLPLDGIRPREVNPRVLVPPGFWIAALDLGDEKFAHAIVMHGFEPVWDPHPKPHPWEYLTKDPFVNGLAAFVSMDPAA